METLIEQYRYQIEALQKENQKLHIEREKAIELLKEILQEFESDNLEPKNYNLL